MKTDLNGVSQCPKGTENYETFYTMVRRKRTKLIQYDYRSEDGELFTCVKPTLTECRKARDDILNPSSWFIPRNNSKNWDLMAKLQST